MGRLFVSISFRRKKDSVCERKMPQIDPDIVKKIEVYVVFHAISEKVSREFVEGSKTIYNKRMGLE